MSEQKTLFEKSDSVNYYTLLEPLPVDQVNDNMQKFAEELYELRNKYRIADLMFVVRPSVRYEDGDIGCPMMLNHYGDSILTEGMAAFAYGRASSERQQNVQRVMAEASRAVKNTPKRK